MKRCLAVMTILALVVVLAVGCAGAPSPMPTPAPVPTPAGEKVNFRLLVSDEANAITDFERLDVIISSIGVHQGGESGTWYEPPVISDDPDDDGFPGIDLTHLQGENALVIWEGNLPPGEYTKVFIYVDEVIGILDGETVDGENAETGDDENGEPVEAEVKLPSNKLQISNPFTISGSVDDEDGETVADEDGQVVNFVYDITVVKAGESGKYILKPQIAESGADKEFQLVNPQGETERNQERHEERHGEPEDELQLQLEGELGLGMEVTLVVTDGGSPVEGATVTINGETVTVTIDGEEVEATTDINGHLTIELPYTPGEVEIEATFEGKSGELEIELEEPGEQSE